MTNRIVLNNETEILLPPAAVPAEAEAVQSTENLKEKLHRQYMELNLEDDFLFSKVMEDTEILRQLLERILGFSIQRVENITPQKAFDLDPGAHGIRLDIYANDENSTRYAVEMQKDNDYNIPKRSRYYISIMDLDQLEKGKDYNRLQQSIVIFFCMFDPFRRGLQKYSFVRRCREDDTLDLMDDTLIVILTDAVTEDADPDLTAFYRYCKNSTAETAEGSGSDLVKQIHERVTALKNNSRLEVQFMKMWERDQRNLKIGRSQGIELGVSKVIRSMLSKNIPDEQIIFLTECSPEYLEKVKASMD